MKIFNRFDCGCDRRKQESGVSNPFEYWLSWWPKNKLRQATRRLAWKTLGFEHLGLGFGDRFMLAEGHLEGLITRVTGETEYRDLGYNTITDAAVAFLVDDFDGGSTDITNFTRHAWGTGACTTPPACSDTALATEAPEARVTGTQSQPAANQYRTVATITAAANRTITEWGLFSQTAVGGTAWSLRCFTGSSIGLLTGDSIQFTYTVTFNCVTG